VSQVVKAGFVQTLSKRGQVTKISFQKQENTGLAVYIPFPFLCASCYLPGGVESSINYEKWKSLCVGAKEMKKEAAEKCICPFFSHTLKKHLFNALGKYIYATILMPNYT